MGSSTVAAGRGGALPRPGQGTLPSAEFGEGLVQAPGVLLQWQGLPLGDHMTDTGTQGSSSGWVGVGASGSTARHHGDLSSHRGNVGL